MPNVKLVVFVPETASDAVRSAMADAGAGKIGNYTECSFTTKGIGRFLPGDGANPAIGQVGTLEAVDEERIEVICPEELVPQIVGAMRAVHPYEEVAFDLYPLLDNPQ